MAEKAAAATKSRNMFLKFLPKAASAPFSPNKEKKSSQKSRTGKGSSGTQVSIIPADALRSRSKNSSFGAGREPTSPKVSCMGTLKHKKKLCSMLSSTNYVLPPLDHLNLMVKNHSNSKVVQSDLEGDVKKKKKPLAIKNMFSRVPSVRRKSSDALAKTTDYVSDHRQSSSSSSLSQMRRFSSSRTSLNNFDWTATQIAPVDNEGKKVIKISTCSVPKVILECKEVNKEPRRDVNLWKRRPMAQPSPLQIQT